MIVNMSEKATEQEIAHIIERIREAGYQPHVTRGVERRLWRRWETGGGTKLRRCKWLRAWTTWWPLRSLSSW